MAAKDKEKHDPMEYIYPVGLIALSAALLGWLKLSSGIHLDVDLAWDDYSSLLTNLFFLTLLTERFIEVFLGVVRIEGKQQIQKSIDYAADDAAREKAERELATYRSVTARRAMQIAFALGLVAALGGVRVIQVIFDATELGSKQLFIFNLTDVVLTAGLIAGGSSGINKITALFAGYLERRTELAKKVTQ